MSFPGAVPRPLVTCPACSGPLTPVGRLAVRIDLQARVLSFAAPDNLQGATPLDVYRCHECGRLDFYDHDFLIDAD
jgi:hypothetical protein